MKATVPEIAWHNKNPVFSIHIQPEINNSFFRAATGGGDSHIVIWHLVVKEVENETTVCVDFAADLDRHIKAVNVVRFSHDSKFLASGDDDAVIIIWALKEDQDDCNGTFANEEKNKENWVSIKVLRGHEDDIYDICWSPLSDMLFSGSVDNTAYLWDISKGQCIEKVGDHGGFVQGVAWDPRNIYMTTLCSDRGFRVFDAETRKLVVKVTKTKVNNISADEDVENEENLMRLFHDDTVSTFFRRLCFSPDGNLIFVPCGIYTENDGDIKPPDDVTYIFLKSKPDRPIFHLPSMDEYTVAVRCCPILFELKNSECNLFTLPYRIVFAIASRRSILLYDTQQLQPFGVVSDIHYATLTDISWSPDGSLLLASSSDGYCTIVTFEKDELGIPYCELPETPDVTLLSPDVTIETLENTPATPEVNPLTLEINPETPEVNPPPLEINPETPEVNPLTLEINPETPEVNPLTLEINPETPEVNPLTLEINPEIPEVNPLTLEINPETPEVNTPTLEINSETQEVNPLTLEINSETPEINREIPEVTSATPEVNPETPEITPEIPKVSPPTLEVTHEIPEVNPLTLEINSETPEINREIPEVTSATPEITPEIPKVSPPTLEVTHEIPEVNPLTLEINPETPEFTLATPEVNPETVEITPEIPKVNPPTLEVTPETPEVNPETPEVTPATPEVNPETPEVNPATLEATPETPEITPEIPKLNSPTLEITPEIPEVNPPTLEIIPATTNITPATLEVISETTDVIHKTPEVTPNTFDDLGVEPSNQSSLQLLNNHISTLDRSSTHLKDKEVTMSSELKTKTNSSSEQKEKDIEQPMEIDLAVEEYVESKA